MNRPVRNSCSALLAVNIRNQDLVRRVYVVTSSQLYEFRQILELCKFVYTYFNGLYSSSVTRGFEKSQFLFEDAKIKTNFLKRCLVALANLQTIQ
jgi:hypothetical protein